VTVLINCLGVSVIIFVYNLATLEWMRMADRAPGLTLTLNSQVVPCCNYHKLGTFPTDCIYVLRTILKGNSGCVHKQD
jgi:hypothetical protein